MDLWSMMKDLHVCVFNFEFWRFCSWCMMMHVTVHERAMKKMMFLLWPRFWSFRECFSASACVSLGHAHVLVHVCARLAIWFAHVRLTAPHKLWPCQVNKWNAAFHHLALLSFKCWPGSILGQCKTFQTLHVYSISLHYFNTHV